MLILKYRYQSKGPKCELLLKKKLEGLSLSDVKASDKGILFRIRIIRSETDKYASARELGNTPPNTQHTCIPACHAPTSTHLPTQKYPPTTHPPPKEFLILVVILQVQRQRMDFFFFFFPFWATPVAYGSSQARGQIGASAAACTTATATQDLSRRRVDL